jgi:hypothetical protein
MYREPAITIGTITAAVAAVLALLASFGLHITDDQQTAILAVVAVAGPFIVGALIRPRVSSPATTDRLKADVLDPDA